MQNLLIANCIVIGLLAIVWEKKNLVNFAIKSVLVALLVFNIMAVSKL